MENKKTKKNPVNFNDVWPILKNYAVCQGLGKVEWLTKSNLNYQRFSEFDNLTRDISARYFLKLIGGLNLKHETAEKVLGKKFTDKQRKLLKFEALVDANRDWLEKLLDDPEVIRLCKSIITAKNK